MSTFQGKTYQELQPPLTIPRGIPRLPNPQGLKKPPNSREVPRTDRIIKLTQLRKDKDHPTGKGFCAALLDTGVSNHNDLAHTLTAYQMESVNGTPRDVLDKHGHGTHVAGIIAGRGISNPLAKGVAYGASIYSIKITRGDSGDGSWNNLSRGLIKVLDHISKPAKSKPRVSVVNISFNGFDNSISNEGTFYHVIMTKIREIGSFNVPVVVSGGNNFSRFKKPGLAYPAFHPYVISVGASSNYPFDGIEEDSVAAFSQRLSENDMSTFILAPGVMSISLDCNNPTGYAYMTGSSQAAPVITGTIMLLQEMAGRFRKKYLTELPPVYMLKQCLMEGCDEVENKAGANSPFGAEAGNFYDGVKYRRVNVVKAIEVLKNNLK